MYLSRLHAPRCSRYFMFSLMRLPIKYARARARGRQRGCRTDPCSGQVDSRPQPAGSRPAQIGDSARVNSTFDSRTSSSLSGSPARRRTARLGLGNRGVSVTRENHPETYLSHGLQRTVPQPACTTRTSTQWVGTVSQAVAELFQSSYERGLSGHTIARTGVPPLRLSIEEPSDCSLPRAAVLQRDIPEVVSDTKKHGSASTIHTPWERGPCLHTWVAAQEHGCDCLRQWGDRRVLLAGLNR